jgi:hypothetical protein
MERLMLEPRAFDHFVLPVSDLATARARFAALGFTVAPDARHPFGTENCCIFLEDGTFIEPLAIGDAEAYVAANAGGNAFTGNDARFRAAGADGFSQLVIRSDDAAADHAAYVDEGLSGGPVLDFGRRFTRADGTAGEVAFRLAFAEPRQDCDAGFFACEVVKAVPGGRGALVRHANGAQVTVAMIATADDPLAMDDFLESFLETQSDAGVEVFYPAAEGALRVVTPDVFQRMFDAAPPETGSFRLAAHVFGVASLDDVRAVVRENRIVHHEKPGWLIVPPASGQPVTLIFQSAEP